MEEIYWGLAVTLLGGILSLSKDWKTKVDAGYFKSNLIGIIGFALIAVGGIKSCSFSKGTLNEKKISDSLANSRQDTIISLNKQLTTSLKSQLDTTITILEYSKKLIKSQSQLSESQNENNYLQSELYSQVVGGYKIDKAFAVSIVVNDKDYLPVLVNYGDDDWMKSINLNRYYGLSHPVTEINGQRVLLQENIPKNHEESVESLEQSLQYKLISDLLDIQHGSTVTGERKSNGDVSSSFTLGNAFKLSNSERIEGKEIIGMFSNRRFSKDINEINRWTYCNLPLPTCTTLSIDSICLRKGDTDKVYKVILTNKSYFRIEFNIEFLGGSGPVSSDLLINKDILQSCSNYNFQINMIANFYNKQKGDPKTIEYKKWAEWVFEELKKINYAQ
jgi:hypothetical protein